MCAVRTHVELALGQFFVIDFHLAGECHHGLHVSVTLLGGIGLHRTEIQHRGQTRGGYDHHLTLAADFVAGGSKEGLHDDFRLLADILRVQRGVLADETCGLAAGHFLVLLGGADELAAGLVRGVVLQHVKDKALLNSLPHTVHVEGVPLAVRPLFAELLQSGILRRGGKGKEREVIVLALAQDFLHQLVLGIVGFGVQFLLLGVLLQRGTGVRQRSFHLGGSTASLRRVSLVDDDTVAAALIMNHLAINHGELLQRGDDDASPGIDGVLQVLRGLFIIDGGNHAACVVMPRDGVAQLGIQHGAVGHHNHAAEDGLILRIEQSGKPVGHPCNGVGLATTRAMLNQVVAAAAVLLHVCHELAYNVQLVVTGEDERLLHHFVLLAVLAAHLLLLGLKVHEAVQNIHQAVALEHLAPDIGYGKITVRCGGVTGTAVLARACAALVERQEVRMLSRQLRGHAGLVEINAEIAQDAEIEPEAALVRVAVVLPLPACIVDILPG